MYAMSVNEITKLAVSVLAFQINILFRTLVLVLRTCLHYGILHKCKKFEWKFSFF